MNEDFASLGEDLEKPKKVVKQPKAKREAVAPQVVAGDETVYEVEIDLAPHTSHINLNGQHYYHGHSYQVDLPTLQTLNEIMHRTWQHEAQLHESENSYRRQRNTVVNKRTNF